MVNTQYDHNQRGVVMSGPSTSKQLVEIRLIRYVIAVAEELHFGRAASHLHLSPPSLSKQIKNLEVYLGYALFERKTRDVILTPAGKAFVAEARHALLHVEQAVEYGYAASQGDTGAFRVGYSPWFRPSLLLALQEKFCIRFPNRPFELLSSYSTSQVSMLLRGYLQASIVELPFHGQGLLTRCVWRDRLVAAVPSKHHLADCGILRRDDFLVEPVIWLAQTLHPALYQHFLDSLRTSGQTPRVGHEVNSIPEMLDLVAARSRNWVRETIRYIPYQ